MKFKLPRIRAFPTRFCANFEQILSKSDAVQHRLLISLDSFGDNRGARR